MIGIGIVPNDPGIGCGGFHGRQAVDDRIGIDCARRTGIFRHAPNRLNRRVVGDNRLDSVHIRAVVLHVDRDYLVAELLADWEMTVVTGHGANEFWRCLLASRTIRAWNPVKHSARDEIVHLVQTAIPADNDHVGRNVQKVGEQTFGFRNAGPHSIVAIILIVLAEMIVRGNRGQQPVAQIKLIRRLFPARHFEDKVSPAKLAILGFRSGFFCRQGRAVEF